MAKRGRISKFTTDTAAAFCGHLAAGLGKGRAAALVGVDAATVYRWLALSRAGRGGSLFARFAADVAAAEARFIASQLQTVVRAAHPRKVRVVKTVSRSAEITTTEVTERVTSDWRAAKWLLECRDPEAFGPDRHAITALRQELAELRLVLTRKLGPEAGLSESVVRQTHQ